jgi:hypothetical protein
MKIRSVFLISFALLILYFAFVQPPPLQEMFTNRAEMFTNKAEMFTDANKNATSNSCKGKCVKAETESGRAGKCSGGCGGGKNGNLLPVLNPNFNLREICKQCILLEDHLFQDRKRCSDCIKKHLLTMEALAEEAITLDKNGECRQHYDLPDKIRKIEKAYLKGVDMNKLAQSLRQIRKGMMEKCFEFF